MLFSLLKTKKLYRCAKLPATLLSIASAHFFLVFTTSDRCLSAVTIHSQPADVVACNGDTVSLSVAATGEGALSFQWRKGTTPITDGNRPSGWFPTSIYAFGSSTFAGTGASHYSKSCLSVLQNMLRTQYPNRSLNVVRFFCLGGTTFYDLYYGYKGCAGLESISGPVYPDAVLLSSGMNDDYGNGVLYRQNLRRILDRIMSWPNTKAFVTTGCPRTFAWSLPGDREPSLRAIREESATYPSDRVILVETFAPFGTGINVDSNFELPSNPYGTELFAHFNDAGHAHYAQIMADSIFDCLNAGPQVTFSGANTPTLTITNADRYVTAGNYNCVITDSEGSVVTVNASVEIHDPVSLTVSAPSKKRTASGPVYFDVAYANADTINLTQADVTLNRSGDANATVSVTNTGNNTRRITLSGITGNGTLSITIAEGTASSGICGMATGSYGPTAAIEVDNTPPAVSVTLAEGQASETGSAPLRYTVAFSKPVQGFDQQDVILSGSSNPSFAAVTGGPSVYTVTVSGMTNSGDACISIPAGAAADELGNASLPSVTPGKCLNYTGSGMRIGEAKTAPNFTSLQLKNKPVTCVFDNCFYIEESDRSSGLKVVPLSVPEGLKHGDIVNVQGIMKTAPSGERYLEGEVSLQIGFQPVAPLYVRLDKLGGSDFETNAGSGCGQVGVEGTCGLNNIGLFVRICGVVKEAGSGWFAIEDGSPVVDANCERTDTPRRIRVTCQGSPPAVNTPLAVTGISSLEMLGSNRISLVRSAL